MLLQPFRSRFGRQRAGAHLVEFALVLPVFVLFMLGFLAISRSMMVSSLLTNAARAGCRVGVATNPNRSTQNVTDTVDALLQGQAISGYATTVLVIHADGTTSTDVSSAQSGDIIYVSISIPAGSAACLPGLPFVTGNLTGQFSMPHE